MVVYSHSRLSTFEKCPLKFKYRYIDNVETEVEASIEMFLGSRVHEVLEKLYSDLKFQKISSLKELLDFLEENWKRNFNSNIIIIRKDYTEKNYFEMAKKFISDYYTRYQPFNQVRTIAIENKILINLDAEGKFVLQGYIDRLDFKDPDIYEIHDYKTTATLPIQEYIKEDRQLALYAIAVKNNYKDAKKIRLIWHFLAFDKEFEEEKTDEELEQLKKETIALIKKIEAQQDFIPIVSKLCDWCEFRTECPKWKHLAKIEEKPVNEYLKDSGVVLVNKYAELFEKKKNLLEKIDPELEKIKEALFKFGETEKVSIVFGSDTKANLWTGESIRLPETDTKEYEELVRILKEHKKFDEISKIDKFLLAKIIRERKWPVELLKKIEKFGKKEKVEKIYLGKIKG